MSEEHYFDFRVYAEDTDMSGIIYHANYLCYFERARTEIIRKYGLSLTMLATYDCHFVINEAKIRYVHPARLEDLLKITSKVIEKKSCSVLFNQQLHNQQKKLLCEAQIKVVCVDGQFSLNDYPNIYFNNERRFE